MQARGSCGEMGWELCGWQGFIRKIAPEYDKVIIMAPSGHEYLYEDFMTDFVPYDIGGKNPNMWMNDNTLKESPLRNSGSVWIPAQQTTLMANAPQQKFIKFGTKTTTNEYDVVYHARSINKYSSDYINTPKEQWKNILSHFKNKRICAIGTKDGADYIEGDDHRGVSLKKTADILASSKLLIGPSSGPMHYGSLCNIPIVVWSGYERSRIRYETVWNPHKSPVHVIDSPADPWGKKEKWRPHTDDIVRAMHIFLEM